MASSDYPNSHRATEWLDNRNGSRVTAFVVIPVLLIAALLLPPVSAVQRVNDRGMTQVSRAGGSVSDPDGTQVTFLPGTVTQPFRAKLNSKSRVAFLEGSAGSDLLAAAKAIPSNLVAKSPYYQLTIHGTAPQQSGWLIQIPNDSEPYETLDVYSWDSAAGRWQWTPHTVIQDDNQIESRVPFVPTSMMVVQTNPIQEAASADAGLANSMPGDSQGALAQVHPTGLFLGGNGALDGALDAGFEKLGSVYSVAPVVRNYQGSIVRLDLLANMLEDPAQRDAHVATLVDLVVGSAYAGLNIDYHGLDPVDRNEFNVFVQKLAEKLHASNKTLGVRVERPAQIAEDRWDTGAYDWVTLGLLVDSLQVPAPLDPQAFLPGGQFDQLLRYAVGQVDRYKLEMVFAGQSVEQAGSYYLLKSYNDALQPLIGRIQADQSVVKPGEPLNLSLASRNPNSGLVYDPNLGSYIYRYADDQGNARTVWLENAASLSHKMQILNRYNVRGFVLENLPGDGQDPDLWTLMRNYQQGRAQPINSNMMVEWTVKDSQGTAITQSRPMNDTKLAMVAPSQPGNLSIVASIKDRGAVFAQATTSGVAVATYTPTMTPTPIATATPSATPTPDFAQFTANDVVNVRSGPGIAYDRLGSLKSGDTFKITGKNDQGDWYQFGYSNGNGWVRADMVSLSGPTDAVAVVKVAAPPTAAPVAAQPAAQPAAAPVARPAGGGSFGYGIQVDPNGGHMAAAAGLGFGWVKIQVPWKDFEGSQGNRNFPDSQVGAANAAGLKVLASIVKAPNWARPGNTNFSVEGPPADPGTFAGYLGAFAGHFCGRVQAIEVWNEENLWYEWGGETIDPNRYIRLLAASYNAIKAACPGTIVISGAPTPTGAPAPLAMDDNAYLQGMYAAGLRNYADGIGAHPSGFANPPTVTFQDWQAGRYTAPSHANHPSFYFLNTMLSYRNIMVANGDTNKRIWPTEFGWGSTSSPHAGYEYEVRVSEQQQATWIVQAYTWMRNSGYVGTAFLWNLDYNVTQPSTELAAFGIMGRPAYSALAGMPK